MNGDISTSIYQQKKNQYIWVDLICQTLFQYIFFGIPNQFSASSPFVFKFHLIETLSESLGADGTNLNPEDCLINQCFFIVFFPIIMFAFSTRKYHVSFIWKPPNN